MQIPLSQGKVAEVDPQDHTLFNEHKWYYRADRNHAPGCAVRHAKVKGKDRLSYLHREIVNAPAGKFVIFLNHDKLDCRRANLKIVSPHEARWYHQARRDSKSGIKGVKSAPGNKWYASITRFGVIHHLGTFLTKDAAQEAYLAAAKRLTHESGSPKTRPKVG
jgi:hypothetical protein